LTARQRRLQKFRAELRNQRLDGAVVSHPANRRYFTGFSAGDSSPGDPPAIVLVGENSSVLLTGATNAPWAQSEAADWEISVWQRPWTTSVARRISSEGWKRIGFEAYALSVASYRALRDELEHDIEWIPIDGALAVQRSTKDRDELAALRTTLALTDEVYAAVSQSMRPGQTEREVAWSIEREFRERGGDGAAFPTIVATGPNAARPHHASGDRPLGSGEPIIIDMGARINGYNGDLTRTVWFGLAPDRLREVYNVVNDASRAAVASIRPGVHANDVDSVARSVIQEAGFGDFFVHGLGHGLGLQVHESPALSQTSTDTLQTGQVVTVEPGIYIPDWGGVRIEDVVAVSEDGCTVISAASKKNL